MNNAENLNRLARYGITSVHREKSDARLSAETRCRLEYRTWDKQAATSAHYDMAVAHLMRIVREESVV